MRDKDFIKEAEKIRVGLLHSLKGVMSQSERPVRYATDIALQEVCGSNSDFGLKLRNGTLVRPKLRIFTRDCESDDRVTANMAQELIYEDRVDVLFGCWTSSGRRLVRPVLESFDRMLFYPVQYEGFEQSSHIVYLGATPNQQIIPALQWALERISAEERPFRYYLVGSDYVYPMAAHHIIEEFLQEYPVEKAGEMLIPLDESEPVLYERVAKQVKETESTVLFNTINGRGNSLLFRQLRKHAVIGESSRLLMVSFSLGETELQEMESNIASGTFISDPFFDSIQGTHRETMLRLSTKLAEKMGLTSGRYPISASAHKAYLSVHLWKSALARASLHAESLGEALSAEKMRIALQDLDLPQSIDPDGGRVHGSNLHTSKKPRIGRIEDTSITVCRTWEESFPPQPFLDRVKHGHIERFLVSEARETALKFRPKQFGWLELRKSSAYTEDSNVIGACYAAPGRFGIIHNYYEIFKWVDELKGKTFKQAKKCQTGLIVIDFLKIVKSYLAKLACSDYDLPSLLTLLATELRKEETSIVPRWKDLAVASAKIKGFLYRDGPKHIRAPGVRDRDSCELFLLDFLDYVSQVQGGSVFFDGSRVKRLTDLTRLAQETSDDLLFRGKGDDVARILETFPSSREIRHEVRFVDDRRYIRYLLKLQKSPIGTPSYGHFFVKSSSKNPGGDTSDAARHMTNLLAPTKKSKPWMLHRCPRKEIDMWKRETFEEGVHVLAWTTADWNRYFLDLIVCRDFITHAGGGVLYRSLKSRNSIKKRQRAGA